MSGISFTAQPMGLLSLLLRLAQHSVSGFTIALQSLTTVAALSKYLLKTYHVSIMRHAQPWGKNRGQILDLGGNTSRGGAVILRKES